MKNHDLSSSELKLLRSLQVKKYRWESGLYLIEGKRAISEALTTKNVVDTVFITETFLNDRENQDLLSSAGKTAGIRIVSNSSLKKISSLKTPPGVVATVSLPKDRNNIPDSRPGVFCVYLDGISNPGNMGSIIRTAAWLGVSNIILSPECVDPYSPKVIQGAMGSHFRTKLITNISPEEIINTGFELIAGTVDGTPVQTFANIPASWILMLGSEAFGINNDLLGSAAINLSIPKLGSGESLNVSVAGGILLSHLMLKKS